MIDSHSFFLNNRSGPYLLLAFGREPWPAARKFERVVQHEAVRLLLAAIGGVGAPIDHRLLQLLEIRQHPGDLHRAELVQLVESRLARGFRLLRTIDAPVSTRRAQREKPPVVPADPPVAVPRTFIALTLLSANNRLLSGLRLELEMPDGETRSLISSFHGEARVDGIPAGSCRVQVPQSAA